MMHSTRSLAVVLLSSLSLAACGGPAAATIEPADLEATVNAQLTALAPPSSDPPATLEPTAPPGSSFEAVSYRDEVNGFAFDHPAGWVVGPLEQHSRGGITAFTSWSRPTDVLPGETPAGETRFDAVVQLWDPKGDLDAFVQQYLGGLQANEVVVTPQDEWTLADGRSVRSFVLTGVGGDMSFVCITTLGDKYLVLSGNGDLTLLAEIAHTLRPLPLAY